LFTTTVTGENMTTELRARPQRRLANIAGWVLQVALAVFFLMAGASKLAGAERAVELFDDVGAGQWLRYLVGALEVAAAIGLLVPALSGAAATGLVALLAGAAVTDAFIIDGNPLLPLILLVLAALVAWVRRDRTAELVRRIKP
jgi:putative oxidoreductase